MDFDKIMDTAWDFLEKSMEQKQIQAMEAGDRESAMAMEQEKTKRMALTSQEKIQGMLNSGLLQKQDLVNQGLMSNQQLKNSGLMDIQKNKTGFNREELGSDNFNQDREFGRNSEKDRLDQFKTLSNLERSGINENGEPFDRTNEIKNTMDGWSAFGGGNDPGPAYRAVMDIVKQNGGNADTANIPKSLMSAYKQETGGGQQPIQQGQQLKEPNYIEVQQAGGEMKRFDELGNPFAPKPPINTPAGPTPYAKSPLPTGSAPQISGVSSNQVKTALPGMHTTDRKAPPTTQAQPSAAQNVQKSLMPTTAGQQVGPFVMHPEQFQERRNPLEVTKDLGSALWKKMYPNGTPWDQGYGVRKPM